MFNPAIFSHLINLGFVKFLLKCDEIIRDIGLAIDLQLITSIGIISDGYCFVINSVVNNSIKYKPFPIA